MGKCKKEILLFWLNKCVQDGLLTAGYTDFIMRVYNQIPQVTSDGKRLQVIKALISVFHQYALEFVRYSSSSVNHVCYVGDCLLCHAAFIRCEEALREDHAFPHMGGSEGRRFCTRNGPSRGGASQPKS